MARQDYLGLLRAGKDLTRGQQLSMILSLSVPAILAQISSVIMQYIDASMVGQLGANASASIGLVASTTWLSRLVVGVGIVIMIGCSTLLFLFAPQMIGMLSPDSEIRALGTALLRIIAFEETFYAAAVVSNGVFRGRGDTLVPSIMTLISMWGVRIPLSAWCAMHYGLKGSWAAVGFELVFRGVIFLVRLHRRNRKL